MLTSRVDKLRVSERSASSSDSCCRIELGSNPLSLVRGLQGTPLGMVELEHLTKHIRESMCKLENLGMPNNPITMKGN